MFHMLTSTSLVAAAPLSHALGHGCSTRVKWWVLSEDLGNHHHLLETLRFTNYLAIYYWKLRFTNYFASFPASQVSTRLIYQRIESVHDG